jgi:hypothetical protein
VSDEPTTSIDEVRLGQAGKAVADLERVFCDPAMMACLGGVWTPHKVAEALREWRQEWGLENRWYGLLLRKDTRAPIGTAGFTENTIPGESGLGHKPSGS